MLFFLFSTIVADETPRDWATDASNDVIMQSLDTTSGWSPLKVARCYLFASHFVRRLFLRNILYVTFSDVSVETVAHYNSM
jgi:hypothetical protein